MLAIFVFFGIYYTIVTCLPTDIDMPNQLNHQMTSAERMATFGSPYQHHFEDSDGLAYYTTYPVDLSRRSKRFVGSHRCPQKLHRQFATPDGILDLHLIRKQRILPAAVFHIDNLPYVEKSKSLTTICRYGSKDGNVSAAVHMSGKKLEFTNGYFVKNGAVFRISPIPKRLAKRSTDPLHRPQHAVSRVRRGSNNVDENFSEDETLLEQLKRKVAQKGVQNRCAVDVKNECPNESCRFDTTFTGEKGTRTNYNYVQMTEGSTTGQATVELGAFVDAEAYRVFSGHLGSDSAVYSFLLLLIDQVDLIFHLPTFGNSLDIKLVYLNILKSQPAKIPSDGNIDATLDGFSEYQKGLNSADDFDSQHWDHAIYLTGRKLYRGSHDYSVMGMSRVGAMCDSLYSATIAELGATDASHHPVQSSGFLSSYMIAHEIGHSLGLFHDGEQNSCSATDNVMSPARAWFGQTTWSSCSQDTLNKKLSSRACLFDTNMIPMKMDLDFKKINKLPGQIYTASAQCAMNAKDTTFVQDRKQGLTDVCNSIQCRRVASSASTNVGPALDGTYCGSNNWCSSGKCVAWPFAQPTVSPGWSSWTSASCQSGCLVGSTGYQITHRLCNNPEPQNTEEYCQGDDHQVALCSDSSICGARQAADVYATAKCTGYVNAGVPGIRAEGKQQPFEADKNPDRSCAVYCKSDESDLYRHPAKAVAIMLGEEAYFPDGTLCNADKNYYCVDHRCVPKK